MKIYKKINGKLDETKTDFPNFNNLVDFIGNSVKNADEKKQLLKLCELISDEIVNYCKEIYVISRELEDKLFEKNKNEQILNNKLKEVKAKIILSKDNAYRDGRKPIEDELIQKIVELRKNKNVRQVAEYLNISIGTVSKYSKGKPEIKKISIIPHRDSQRHIIFDEQQKREIRRRFKLGEKLSSLAKEAEISEASIYILKKIVNWR